MSTSWSLWRHRESVTADVVTTIYRRDYPKTEQRYYEALQDQFTIMIAEGGRTVMTMWALTVLLAPKVIRGNAWIIRVPLIALWATQWRRMYFFGADVRVHLGLGKLLREMQESGQTTLAAHAHSILKKYA